MLNVLRWQSVWDVFVFIFTYRPYKETRGGKQSQHVSLPGKIAKGNFQLKIITWRILQGDINDLTIDYYNCFMNWKELEGKKKYARDLQNVADEPAMGQNDVDELNKRVRYS